MRYLVCCVLVAALLGFHSPGNKHVSQTSADPSIRLAGNVDETVLDAFIKGAQYPELATAVDHMPPSGNRKYFAGILANREGKIQESAALLAGIIPRLKTKHPARAAVALQTLAEDYVQMYRYADASQVYGDLLHNFADRLSSVERQSVNDDAALARLLREVEPETVTFNGTVDVPLHREPGLGTLDANVTVGDRTESWILDTGANVSTVSASFAHMLGLPFSTGEGQVQGTTGAESKLHVAVVPALRLGSATVSNVVLLVLDDKNLDIQTGKDTHHQINAILGYPVLRALNRLSFVDGDRLLAGPGSPSGNNGAPMFLDDLTPLLECKVENRNELFSFDTGATSTSYSDRYAKEFPAQLKTGKKMTRTVAGAGGSKKLSVVILAHPQLAIGNTSVTLQNVPVMPQLGTTADKLFGNLGRDVVKPYSSFTLDFGIMRFKLGKKLNDN